MALIVLESVSKTFPRRGRGDPVVAVDDVTIDIEAGETLALIGESGSGKSTLGRIALGIIQPDKGTVRFRGDALSELRPKEMRRLRSQMSMVFQEPYESLNPQMRVDAIVAEPLVIHERNLTKADRRRRVVAMLDDVGLSADYAERRPVELSGGQQQRVGIARAMITRPSLVVLDEPISSLDLSIRAQILNLLIELQVKYGSAYLFISHDIATVAHIGDRVAVMLSGRIVESGQHVMEAPRQEYTRKLLAARLSVDPPESEANGVVARER